MSLTGLLFWLMYAGGAGAALLYPLAGVLVYIVVYHLHPESQWWGHAVGQIGLRTSMTLAVATAIGIAVRRPRFEPGGRQFPLPFALALGLVVLALGSLLWGYGTTGRALGHAEKFAKIMIFVAMLIRCVRRPQHYHLALCAWLLGVFYLGYQAYGGAGGRVEGRLSLGLGGPDFAESSGLAVHLVASLPFIGALFFMARRWWSRGLILLTGALTVNTIIMTRTRNAIVGFVAICAVAALSLPRGYRLKGWLAIALGTLLASRLADPAWWNRMASVLGYDWSDRVAVALNYRQDPSVAGRIAYWRAAFQMARDYPLGVGVGNFNIVVQNYVAGLNYPRSAHNTLLACLAELGIPGLLLLLGLVGLALRRLTRIRRRADQLDCRIPLPIGRWQVQFHLGWHAMALRAALVGYLTCGLFTTRLYTEGFWILLGLACCLDNVAAAIFSAQRRGAAPLVATGAAPAAPAPGPPAQQPAGTSP